MQKSGTSFAADPHAVDVRNRRKRLQLRDNGLGFSPITIVNHWVVAALVMSIIVIEVVLWTAYHPELAKVLNLLGTVLFPISLYRFWSRVTSYHPLPVGTPNPIEVIVSRSVATALALAMVLLPIAAWLSKSAAGEVIGLPGGYVIPSLMGLNVQVAHGVDFLFKLGATLFILGLALHIFGACKNHFLLKNDTLKRMLGKHVEL